MFGIFIFGIVGVELCQEDESYILMLCCQSFQNLLNFFKGVLISIVQFYEGDGFGFGVVTLRAEGYKFIFCQFCGIPDNSMYWLCFGVQDGEVMARNIFCYFLSEVQNFLGEVILYKLLEINRFNLFGLNFLQNLVIVEQLLNHNIIPLVAIVID
jgi:hypothetical protein